MDKAEAARAQVEAVRAALVRIDEDIANQRGWDMPMRDLDRGRLAALRWARNLIAAALGTADQPSTEG
jgi:hypothetical protein